jgi:hypothetical protein
MKVAVKPVEKTMAKTLRIAVLNKSGNVGKTTIVSCIIAPRLQALVKVAYVELTNAMPDVLPAPVGAVYGAHEFADVENELLQAKRSDKSMVVDFGASDYNTTLEMLAQYTMFKKAVDLYVIPCLPEGKIQDDTIEVIDNLIDLGIDISKVRVLFNQVAMRDKKNIRRTFSAIFEKQAEIAKETGKTFGANEQMVMYEAEVFKQLGKLKMPLADILADETDYDAAIAAEPDEDEQFYLSRLDSVRGMAQNTQKTINAVFEALVEGV